MKSARAVVLALLFALALGAGSARATVVPTVVGNSQAEAVFAQPLPGEADPAMHNHLLSLINNTPDGGEIRAAIHSIGDNIGLQIANALVERAQVDNVAVRIVYPENKRGSAAAGRLAALGTDKTQRSWVHWCNHNGAGVYGDGCISTKTGSSADAGGTMHSKYFLFSASGPGGLRKWVTWFGSANLTQGTGADTWNDGMTVYENQALYTAFKEQLFEPMRRQTPFANNDFYNPGAGQGYFSIPSAGIEVHASPDQDTTDMVVSQLSGISTGPGCTVLVATNTFTRTDVAYRLEAMKYAGCQVLVLVGMGDPSPTVANPNQCGGKAKLGDNTNVFDILTRAKIPIRKKKIHNKLILLAAPGITSRVFTGSHNLTSAARKENDEILVEVASASAYDTYAAYWAQAWTEGGCNVTSYYP